MPNTSRRFALGDVRAWFGEKPGVLRPCFVGVRGQGSNNDDGMHDYEYNPPLPQSSVLVVRFLEEAGVKGSERIALGCVIFPFGVFWTSLERAQVVHKEEGVARDLSMPPVRAL
ncbi:unnamed protein product [Ectocarpus sp. 6 AP-2014]